MMTDDVKTVFIYFFFQAEDGIRDRNVTGVQTCALPIFAGPQSLAVVPRTAAQRPPLPGGGGGRGLEFDAGAGRSEERRVGKECRCWGWPSDEKEKKRVGIVKTIQLRIQ